MQSLLDLLRGRLQQQAFDGSEFAALLNVAEAGKCAALGGGAPASA